MPKHPTLAELTAGLSEILTSPAEEGNLRAVVIRPASAMLRPRELQDPPYSPGRGSQRFPLIADWAHLANTQTDIRL